jgi:hypothetical protein
MVTPGKRWIKTEISKQRNKKEQGTKKYRKKVKDRKNREKRKR